MSTSGILRMVDAVTVPVPDLEQGLRFYRDRLGHELLWRSEAIGQAALRLPESSTELVLSTGLSFAPIWLVASVEQATETFVAAGGRVLTKPARIAVGEVAVVADPFGNALVLLDLSAGRYVTDPEGNVIGVESNP